MSSLWSAVKQIRSEKRFKNAPAPLDAVASRVRQLQKDLQLLRRACRQDRDFCLCLDNIISHNQKLPADIEKVGKWCERLVGPFILYIEAFIKTSSAPSSLSSLRKAPFTFLEEIKELLSQLEKMTSKSCGVNAITAILSASRRMLTLQSSNEGLNDFVFNNVRSLATGQGVSAAFNPVDIMERALFDICVGDDKETVCELLLLQSQGTKSLAVCEVRPFGQRSLMYPPFRGSGFGFNYSETTLTLSQGENLIVMSAASYVVNHWKPILERLFDVESSTPPRQTTKAQPAQISGLGIALGDEFDERNDNEKFGEEFEDDNFEDERPSLNRPGHSSTITASESLNALKRISVGMPVDFSEDLAKILRGIEEEDESSPRPKAEPYVDAIFAARPSTAPSTLAAEPLMAPTAPFARSVPSLDPRSQAGSPASFFSEFSQSKGTPSSMASSPRTLDEADAVRKRIAARISSREKESSQERFFSPASQGEPSVQSIQISDSSEEECEEEEPAERAVHAADFATTATTNHISQGPPSIPAPVYGAQRATVVRVSTPRRINFGSDEYVPISTSSDLSAVPISPMPSRDPKTEQTKVEEPLGYKHSAKSQPTIPRPNAPQRPRVVQSVYSPKVGTPTLPRSFSDEKHAAQDNIWFEEPNKVKATFASLFKKKSKTPKAQHSPKFKGARKEREPAPVAFDKESEPVPKQVEAISKEPEAVPKEPEAVPKEPEVPPPPVPVAVPVAVPSQAEPQPAEETEEQPPLPNSSSLRSLKSAASSSEPDLGASLGNRASTIFYKRISKMNRESFCPAPVVETSDATAVCVDSHNNTAAPMSFGSLASVSDSSSLNNSQSYASLESKVTMSTANTSFGSAKAWSEFMDGVKNGAAKHMPVDESKQRALQQKAQELKRLEAEVESKKQAIEEASSRVRQMDSSSSLASESTLDPGLGMSSQVNRSVPILRELYAEKETKAAHTVYQNASAFSSVPALPSIQPLSVKKANSVTFSEPSTPTSISTTQFSGFLWVSKWTVNRWMPLSQKELPVEIVAGEDQDSIVITMPGTSRPIKLRFNCDCDLRVSNAHDVEVRVKGEVYMFRSRSSQRCKKFFKAIEGLQVDIHDASQLASSTSSDSDTSSGSTTSNSSRRCAPPKLNNSGPLATRTNISHYPIIEE